MNLHPLRLPPGADLRASLEHLAATLPQHSGFVVCGIGSLACARIRMADETVEQHIDGPLEVISLAGSISKDGAHLHMSVADRAGAVLGGHVGRGCTVRTTAEILVAAVPGYQLAREVDPATGFLELVVRPHTHGAADA